MNTRAIFISDIHISAPDDPRCILLGELLDECQRGNIRQIFLVGDIFDFWIADRNYLIERFSTIIGKLKGLIESGVRVHYFEGNHDLDLKAFWQNQLGAEVHSGAGYFHVGGLTIRVEHGDQMDPSDRGYLFLRWLLRTKIMVCLGRVLPERVVQWIGQHASATSRDYTTQIKTASEESVREKMRAHAERVFATKGFDLLIAGHVHVSEDSLQVTGGTTYRCINLGTWLKEPLLLEIDGSISKLKTVQDFLQESVERK